MVFLALPSDLRIEIEERLSFRDRCALRCASPVAMAGSADGLEDLISAGAAVVCHGMRTRGEWTGRTCVWTVSVTDVATITFRAEAHTYLFVTFQWRDGEIFEDRSAARSCPRRLIERIRRSIMPHAPRVVAFNLLMDGLVHELLHELSPRAALSI